MTSKGELVVTNTEERAKELKAVVKKTSKKIRFQRQRRANCVEGLGLPTPKPLAGKAPMHTWP